MPLGGLRSSVDGTLDDFEFPDTDNLPRRNRRATMAENQNQNENQAPVAAAVPVEIWTENPNQGKFNPGTKAGEAIFKLKSSSGLEENKKLTLARSNAPEFRRILESKESSFGGIVSRVPVEFDNAGVPIKYANLIKEYATVEMETLQRNALKRFGTAIAPGAPIPKPPFHKRALDPANNDADKTIFYERVDSHVSAEWLKNVFDTQSYAKILLERDFFTFVDQTTGLQSFDGVVMLFIVLNKLDPSVVVGIELLRKKLETIRLHQYKNNVDDMCTVIRETMKLIEGSGNKCESIRRYVIEALRSGDNTEFNGYVSRINDDVEARTGVYKDMTWEQILETACTKFTNMESTNTWSHVDPREVKLLALTTRIQELENMKMKPFTGEKDSGGNNHGSYQIEEWRFVKDGETVSTDGKKWWWCDKHNSGKGMYVRHPPSEHDDWAARKKAGEKYVPPDYRANSNSGDGNPSKPSDVVTEPKKLAISENLRSVLCNQLMLSDDDADKLCTQVFKDT